MPFEFLGEGIIEARSGSYMPEVDSNKALRAPEGYRASKELTKAVNVALKLGMPLLVTGEPGTGKTQLAYRIAYELGLDLAEQLFRFDTKSSSQASELFYSFDSVRHFAMAQLRVALKQEPLPAADFVRYGPLGKAILQSKDPALAKDAEVVRKYFGPDFPRSGPKQSLVLIDEIDKAPRDFPNDLLNQIENLEFSVPELDAPKVEANGGLPPVVVITSNSEKNLPEPFLRRCVYHHIEFPKNSEEIDRILGERLSHLQLSGTALRNAVEFFLELRADENHLNKKPSISELLDWLRALANAKVRPEIPLRDQKESAAGCLGSLVKMEADVKIAKRLLGVE